MMRNNIYAVYVGDYLAHCRNERRLDEKTERAYRCDLRQVLAWVEAHYSGVIDRDSIRSYLAYANSLYAPATVKRKLASLNAFLSYMEDRGIIERNPFVGLRLSVRTPKRLPRTIALSDLEALYSDIADECAGGKPGSRDRAVLELLIATGVRVSELCALDVADCDLRMRTLRIRGKGSRERVVQLESEAAIVALRRYLDEVALTCRVRNSRSQALFLNRFGNRLSAQAVRSIVKSRAKAAGVSTHITPHMFRHTFATLLLESGVDIRYIQSLLGHSSVKTTEIYTHVAAAKQREVLRRHNPRNAINAGK